MQWLQECLKIDTLRRWKWSNDDQKRVAGKEKEINDSDSEWFMRGDEIKKEYSENESDKDEEFHEIIEKKK
ncbi:hypothetical protein AgCh_032371 [Apium graveolens]